MKALSTAEQSIYSKALLTLFKRKRIQKPAIVVAKNSAESSVGREPLIKRMKKPAVAIIAEGAGETTIRENVKEAEKNEAREEV